MYETQAKWPSGQFSARKPTGHVTALTRQHRPAVGLPDAVWLDTMPVLNFA
jgi:hypothetical protein